METNDNFKVGQTVYYLDFAMAGNVMVAQGDIKAIYKWPKLDNFLMCEVTNNPGFHGHELPVNRLYLTKKEAATSLEKNVELLKIKHCV